MKVSLIVAVDAESGIGKDNDLMWHLPEDMKFFKDKTSGQIVVMGRKNYESIPKRFRPLPNRDNVVLTKNKDFEAEGCKVFNSLNECLIDYENEEERTVFIRWRRDLPLGTGRRCSGRNVHYTHKQSIWC